MHSIHDVSRSAGLSSRTLRVWEEEGLLAPLTRDANGVRQYSDSVFSRIRQVQALKELGLTLAEIREVLGGSERAAMADLFRNRMVELETQAARLLSARRRLTELEALLGISNRAEQVSPALLSLDNLVEKSVEDLLQESPFAGSKAHQSYLASEFMGMEPFETSGWLSSLRRVRRRTDELRLPLVLRGFGASSLSLTLLGLSELDPLAEGLVPTSPNAQELHFDIPYSGSDGLLELIDQINRENESAASRLPALTAFRLPVLDILESFACETGIDPAHRFHDHEIFSFLRESGCHVVYGLDESGAGMVWRLFSELPDQERSVEVIDTQLKRLNPHSREEIFRLQAFRRQESYDLLQKYLSGEALQHADCVLAREMPGEERGFPFFRETILHAVQRRTQWSWPEIHAFRRQMRTNGLDGDAIERFVARLDAESLELWRSLEGRTLIPFHKAHLVGQWTLTRMSACCARHDAALWKRLVRSWEDEHGLAWNDFGVASGHCRILDH